jgi:hypothetical protein
MNINNIANYIYNIDESMEISTELEHKIEEEIESNYIYKINKDGSTYKGQLEKYKLINTPTNFHNGQELINIKQYLLKSINETDIIKKYKEQSNFLNRHLDEIILSVGCSKGVYEYMFNKRHETSLFYKILDFILYLFANNYPYKQEDKSIKMENIYDNIDTPTVNIIAKELAGFISSQLIILKNKKLK